jgi:hypothetical protein
MSLIDDSALGNLAVHSVAVTKNVTLFGHVLAFVRFQFEHCICNVRACDYRVTLKYAACFPAAYDLDDPFRNSGPPEIPGGRPPKIVEQQPRYSSSLASLRPSPTKISDGFTVLTGKNIVGQILANSTSAQKNRGR